MSPVPAPDAEAVTAYRHRLQDALVEADGIDPASLRAALKTIKDTR